jgi:hypothetical protein
VSRFVSLELASIIMRAPPTSKNVRLFLDRILARAKLGEGDTLVVQTLTERLMFDHTGQEVAQQAELPPVRIRRRHIPPDQRVYNVLTVEQASEKLGVELTMEWLARNGGQALVESLGITPEQQEQIACVEFSPEEIVCFNYLGELELPPFSMGEKKYPSLFRQAMNFAGAVSRNAARVFTGRHLMAPPEVVEQRKVICRGCEKWDAQALKGTGRCTVCGCSTSAKLALAGEACPHPDGPRWGPHDQPAE